MLNDKLAAGQAIHGEIKITEAAIDDALASLGRLTSKLVEARREFGVDLSVGTKAFDRLGEATSLICQTRAKVLGVHSVLNDVHSALPGFQELVFGPCQSSTIRIADAPPSLRAVS